MQLTNYAKGKDVGLSVELVPIEHLGSRVLDGEGVRGAVRVEVERLARQADIWKG